MKFSKEQVILTAATVAAAVSTAEGQDTVKQGSNLDHFPTPIVKTFEAKSSNNKKQVANYMEEFQKTAKGATKEDIKEAKVYLNEDLKRGEKLFGLDGVFYSEDNDFISDLNETLPTPANYSSFKTEDSSDSKLGDILSSGQPFSRKEAFGMAKKLIIEGKAHESSVIFREEGGLLCRLFMYNEKNLVMVQGLTDIDESSVLSGTIYFSK